jgi:hypothetical protein
MVSGRVSSASDTAGGLNAHCLLGGVSIIGDTSSGPPPGCVVSTHNVDAPFVCTPLGLTDTCSPKAERSVPAQSDTITQGSPCCGGGGMRFGNSGSSSAPCRRDARDWWWSDQLEATASPVIVAIPISMFQCVCITYIHFGDGHAQRGSPATSDSSSENSPDVASPSISSRSASSYPNLGPPFSSCCSTTGRASSTYF